MRLSFIVAGSPDRPLLMLSDFAGHELGQLRETAGDLASGQRDEADLRGDAASELRLLFRMADRNIGIRRTPPRFECALSRHTWSNIEGLIEPFLRDDSGFQWLDESGEVALLLSPRRTW
jgi:hypothetical protein